jgi:hypothetical protein
VVGYLATRALSEASPTKTSGNYRAGATTTSRPAGPWTRPRRAAASKAVPVFLEIGEIPVLRSDFYGGTRLAARDDFMREHAIVKLGLQKHLAEVPPRGPGAGP